MKIKGFVTKIDVNMPHETVYSIDGGSEQIPTGPPQVMVEMRFDGNVYPALIEAVRTGEEIEFDVKDETAYKKPKKVRKPNKWRLIRL
jgi:hypothetical protein